MQATQISEAQALLEALDRVPPTAFTACAGWTAHEITAHLAAGADEIARLFEAYGEGLPVPPTSGFEEREAPYRAMDDRVLRQRLFAASARMASAMHAVLSHEPDAVIPFTGMQFKASTFLLHSRSESAIHRWDLVGDDDISLELLSRPEITEHAVTTLAPLLFSRGCGVAPASGVAISARIRTAGQPDIAIRHDSSGASLALTADDGRPAIEADAAARLLFIWGRRPGDPSRITSTLAPQESQAVEALLAGG